MDPSRWPHATHPLSPDWQAPCYIPWLKLRVLIRAAGASGRRGRG
jgi:hypothetical protein